MSDTDPTSKKNRIYLSPPHMSEQGQELQLLVDAFQSNWIAPLGPDVDAFEQEFADKLGVPHAVALSSGTAALHLALLAVGVRPGEEVLTSTFTFIASTNAIRYVGAEPVFIDSEQRSWNIDPQRLADELAHCHRRGKVPAAVLVVDVCGQTAYWEAIRTVCQQYDIPLIEDAAESLGADHGGTPAGALGDIGCFSFNGNKIITTSGGGMLVTQNAEWAKTARHLASQAREPVAHYEHRQIGYNYRLSNLLAAVGRGQLRLLDQRVEQRRANFRYYQQTLGDLPGLSFMPELEGTRATRWLTCVLIDPERFGNSAEGIRLALETENIEARPVWKPMHLQSVYSHCRTRGGEVAESFFEQGLCLPSGSSLSADDLGRIVAKVRQCCSASAQKPLAAMRQAG